MGRDEQLSSNGLATYLLVPPNGGVPGEPGTLQPKFSSRSSSSCRSKIARAFAMNSSRPFSPGFAAYEQSWLSYITNTSL